MRYALLLWPHANIRYMEALHKLAKAELGCLLDALGITATIRPLSLGGAPFLSFESDPLDETAQAALSSLSSFYLCCLEADGRLTPLPPTFPWSLPADAAEVLKYKGKTNASFTALMLNCALFASDFFPALPPVSPLTVLDPMCGKGTTLFCALRRGFNAAGIEIDKGDAGEAADYFSRYLQMHRLKHQKKSLSLTLPQARSAPETRFTFTPPAGGELCLRLIHGDARQAGVLLKAGSVHLMVCDLPYGVQHAPQAGRRTQSFETLLAQCLSGLRSVLRPGGAAAFSFNTYTLPRQTLCALLEAAGFSVVSAPPYHDFAHWVEQAVNRDVIIAR